MTDKSVLCSPLAWISGEYFLFFEHVKETRYFKKTDHGN